MHKCSWCNTNYINWQNKCDQCGGPMPPLPGMGLGPPPPAVPRTIPPRYQRRVRWTENIGTLVGGIFFAIGGLMTVVMTMVSPLFALFPGLFAVGGFFMFRHGWKHASGVLNAFKNGRAVEGRIASVTKDTSQSVNHQNPWKLVYHFPLENQLHEGSITTFDSSVSARMPGQPLWVLYNESEPSQSAIYPPIA